MKILCINDRIKLGGAATFTRTACKFLANAGNEVHLVYGLDSSDDKKDVQTDLVPGFFVHHVGELSKSADEHFLNSYNFAQIRVMGNAYIYQAIIDFIKKEDFDLLYILNLHEFFGVRLISSLRNVFSKPILFQYNDNDLFCVRKYNYIDEQRRVCTDCLKDPESAFQQKCWSGGEQYFNANMITRLGGYYQKAIESIDAFLVTSGNSFRLLKQMGIQESQIVMGNNPLDFTRFTPGEIGDYLIYYGMPLFPKGIEILGQALTLADIKEFRFYFLYNHPQLLEELTKLVKHRNFPITARFDINWQNGLYDIAANARGIIIPSQWDTPSELVVGEGASMGRALVVSDLVSRSPLIEENKNALVFKATDVEALAACMTRLSKDAELAKQMGDYSRQIAEQQLGADKWYKTFEEAVDRARSRKNVTTTVDSGLIQIGEKSQVEDEDKYLISVLVSTYKSQEFMRDCLTDLVDQTLFDRIEVIVIDANSPENEGETVQEFQKKYSNIIYKRTSSRIGVYAAWNLAAKMARGKYLSTFSTNDRLRKNAFELMVRKLEENPDIDLIYGNTYITSTAHETFENHTRTGAMVWPAYSYSDLLENCRVGPHPVWRRCLHQDIGYFDESFVAMGDQDFWIRVGESHQILHIPEFTGLYWHSSGAITGNIDRNIDEISRIRKMYREKNGGATIRRWDLARVLINEAQNELNKGNEKKGFELINSARKTALDFPQTWIASGQYYKYKGDHKQAAENFVKACEYSPDNWNVRIQIIDEWVEAGNTDAAQKELQALLDLIPNSEEVKKRQGTLNGILIQDNQNQKVYDPNDTLALILDADDIVSAIEQYQNRFDERLLDLVQRNKIKAQADQDDELAEGLENLSILIKKKLDLRVKRTVNVGVGKSPLKDSLLPKITIVTPSFNQGEYLEECILSIISQGYPNLEYIVMDGGSTDQSLEIIRKYSQYITYWQSQPDGGQYAAINQGFNRSTGEVMGWLNSDDCLFDNSLFKIAFAFLQNPQVEWLTGRSLYSASEKWTINPYLDTWNKRNFLDPEVRHFIQQEGTFWKRSLWEKAGGCLSDNMEMAADFELWMRFFRHANLFSLDEIIGGFRFHTEQKTVKGMEVYQEEVRKIVAEEMKMPSSNGLTQQPPLAISGTEVFDPKIGWSSERAFYLLLTQHRLDPILKLADYTITHGSQADTDELVKIAEEKASQNLSNSVQLAGYLQNKPYLEKTRKLVEGILDKDAKNFYANKIARDIPGMKFEVDNEFLVTVIVPVEEQDETLADCLENLVNQTLNSKGLTEILIVSRYPSGKQKSVIQSFQKKHSNIIQLISKKSTRSGGAMNSAIKKARGKYHIFVRVNDCLKLCALQTMAETLDEKEDIALVYGDSYITSKSSSSFNMQEQKEGIICPDYSFKDLVWNNRISPHSMWRRSLHEEIGYFDESQGEYGMDEFWFRLAENHEFLHIPVILGLRKVRDKREVAGNVNEQTQKVRLQYLEKYRETLFKTWFSSTDLIKQASDLEQRGELLKSGELLKQAVTNAPDFHDASKQYAIFLSRHDQETESIPHFYKAIELEPGDLSTQSIFADVLRKLKRIGEGAYLVNQVSEYLGNSSEV